MNLDHVRLCHEINLKKKFCGFSECFYTMELQIRDCEPISPVVLSISFYFYSRRINQLVLVSQDLGSFIFIWLCPSPQSPGLFKVNQNRNNRRELLPLGSLVVVAGSRLFSSKHCLKNKLPF